MTKTQEYISKEKLKELQHELDHLKNVRRSEIAKELERTRSLGDLSENAEYHQAREDQGWTEARILEIEHIIRNSKVVSDKHSDIVSVGSTVVIQKMGEKTKKEIQIVGSEEVDSLTGKISFHSPLGEALMGKRTGEKAMVKTPKGETEYKILEVK